MTERTLDQRLDSFTENMAVMRQNVAQNAEEKTDPAREVERRLLAELDTYEADAVETAPLIELVPSSACRPPDSSHCIRRRGTAV